MKISVYIKKAISRKLENGLKSFFMLPTPVLSGSGYKGLISVLSWTPLLVLNIYVKIMNKSAKANLV